MAESNEMLAEMRDMMRNLTREVSTLKEDVTQLKSEKAATSKQPVVQNPPNVIPGFVRSVISPEDDFYDEQYVEENCLPQSVKPSKEKELVDKVEKLTQQVESMQAKGPRKINMSDFSLFPGVTLPPKFRMPDFDKYDGTGCPSSHLRSFISNLEGYGLSPEQIAKVFPMSLAGVAKKWFLHLKPEELGTLDEIANKFVEQFSMEEGIEVTKRDLKAIKQGPQETFTSFVRRWRRKAAQMTNRPSEEDRIKIVVKNLSPQYYHFMATQYYSDFNHLIKTGTITEDALLKGSLAKSSFDPRNGKKPMVVSKPEVSNVVAARPMRRVVAETEQPMRKAPRHFDLLPYPLSVALKKLLRDKKITLLEPRPPPPILPRYWREDQHCAYHQGTGHLTDNCMALRHKIQDMIEAKKIAVFMPNTTRNPLPAHAPRLPPTVGAIFTEEPIPDPASLICAIASDSPTVLAYGEEVEEVEEEKPYVLGGDEDDYAESSTGPYILQFCHVTRGGRIFKPVELRAENPAEVVRAAEAQKQNKPSCEEEDESLLRQLKKTQANISIWGLLMASPKHRQVVLRELNAAQVSVDITSDELVGLVAMARVSKTLSFTDEDLTSEGHNRTRPLKITVVCNGKKVPDVLVDNGSALNVCPLATATVLGFGPNDFIPSEQGILAYDGTRRDVIGTLATEILIGGEIFEVEFQKLKFIRNNKVITVKGDPDLEVGQILQEGTSEKKGDVSLTGFSVEVTAISFEKAKNEEILFLTSTNPRVVKMMRKQVYLPGAGLGRNHQGIVEWPVMRKNEGLFGLGYEPSRDEIREMRNYMRKWSELRRQGLELPMKPFSLIRNGKYRREGDDFAFCGFAEPWVDELTGQELPGFEIFFDMELPDEYPSLQIHEIEPEVDWADILEPCLLNSLFQVELPIVAMIGGDALILDPESLITPAEGPLTNWSSQVIPRVVIQYSPVSIKESVVSSYMSISESRIEFAISDVSFDAGTVVIEPVDEIDEESSDAAVRSDTESVASSVESTESIKSVHTIVQSDDESVKVSKDFNTEPIEGASTDKSIKGRVIAEQLADSPTENNEFLKAEFPDEEIMTVEDEVPDTKWLMYFDGAVNNRGQGLEAAMALHIQDLDVFGDSILIICQTNGNWKTRDDKLIPYNTYLESLVRKFENITFTHLSRTKNHFADALATLASMLDISTAMEVQPLEVRLQWAPSHVNAIEIAARCSDGKPWYTDIKNFISGKGHPSEASGKERRSLQKLASSFVICGEELYRRSFDGIQLLCIDEDQAAELIEQTHEGVCGPHMNGKMLSRKILRLGYYWSTMEADCYAYVKKFHKCQVYANLIHVPLSQLHSLTSSWPFSVWGIDIIGKISPKSSSGHEYILVAIDYFTKWIEATSYASLTSASVAKFVRANIICKYGVPHELISDNGSHFKKEVARLCEEFKIKHHKSSPYRPQTNGAVEAANKNIKVIIRMEAVLPVELRIPSLRVMMEAGLPESVWAQARYQELQMIDEKRLKALYHVQGYQRRVERAFNKKVRVRDLKKGDLVQKSFRAPLKKLSVFFSVGGEIDESDLVLPRKH
ncbi:uncharacterized protein LOC143856681 [Tasmannia lanceolata]|uniref:uncharacterized protein LOC143856681 n=1 Tax=Tasmannia lanceolata TaxID=3420 RepID=UPI004062A941